jgi:hypothetical protein
MGKHQIGNKNIAVKRVRSKVEKIQLLTPIQKSEKKRSFEPTRSAAVYEE